MKIVPGEVIIRRHNYNVLIIGAHFKILVEHSAHFSTILKKSHVVIVKIIF